MTDQYRYGTPDHVRACNHAASMLQTNWSILRTNDLWLTQMEVILRSSFKETKPEAITKAAAKYIAESLADFPPPAGKIVKAMRGFIGNSKLKTTYQDCELCDGGLRLVHYWERIKQAPRMTQVFASCKCEAGRKKQKLGVHKLEVLLEILDKRDNLITDVWVQTRHEERIPMELQVCPDREWWDEGFKSKTYKPLAKHLPNHEKDMLTLFRENSP